MTGPNQALEGAAATGHTWQGREVTAAEAAAAVGSLAVEGGLAQMAFGYAERIGGLSKRSGCTFMMCWPTN
jgi:hypothetical protein